MKICKSCKSECNDSVKFCTTCGSNKFEENTDNKGNQETSTLKIVLKVLLWICFWPIMIMVKLWKSEGINKVVKIIVTAVYAIVLLFICLIASVGSSESDSTSTTVTENAKIVSASEITTVSIFEDVSATENEESAASETTTTKPATTEKGKSTTKQSTTKTSGTSKTPSITKSSKPQTIKAPSTTRQTASTNSDSEIRKYVLNTHTGVFHYPSCGSVKRISQENYSECYGTHNEVVNKGYKPCGNCHP